MIGYTDDLCDRFVGALHVSGLGKVFRFRCIAWFTKTKVAEQFTVIEFPFFHVRIS